MTPKALSVEYHDFQPGEELFLDANIWLLIYGPQNPGNARMHVYSLPSSAGSRKQKAVFILIDVLIASELLTLAPDCDGNLGRLKRRSKLFVTVRSLSRSLRK